MALALRAAAEELTNGYDNTRKGFTVDEVSQRMSSQKSATVYCRLAYVAVGRRGAVCSRLVKNENQTKRWTLPAINDEARHLIFHVIL